MLIVELRSAQYDSEREFKNGNLQLPANLTQIICIRSAYVRFSFEKYLGSNGLNRSLCKLFKRAARLAILI